MLKKLLNKKGFSVGEHVGQMDVVVECRATNCMSSGPRPHLFRVVSLSKTH